MYLNINTLKFLIFVFCFGLVCNISYAQNDTTALNDFPYDSTTGKVEYTITSTNKLSKESMYKNAQTWIAKTFGDYKSVVQLDDKTSGRIILKGKVQDPETTLDMKYAFTLMIDIKAMKFRAKLSDISEIMTIDGNSKSETIEDKITRFIKRTDAYRYQGNKGFNKDSDRLKGMLLSLKNSIETVDDF
ncbi:hypothetical protein GCM10023149_48970 [Mucilaginibacter gynuensis]|uniref:DUF4468 domain-containing protein n=1 Tax=Mucilaginibacter gynuensis TaxID=1302236 RepID=A0ABP8HFP9_9SPHI